MEPYIMPFVWLGIALFAGVLEASTGQLVSIWFVLGAIVSAIVSVFTPDLTIQIAIFLVVSFIAVFATRPFVKRITKKAPESTNADRYVGKTGKVITEIDNQSGKGQINVSGSIWSARSSDGTIVPVGEEVRVEKIEGVKLIIKPLRKAEVK